MTKTNNLSDRWNKDEAEHLPKQVDRLNHGDVSAWAKAVSKPWGSQRNPKRPEVPQQKIKFTPVSSLEACVLHPQPERKHDSCSIVMPEVPADKTVAEVIDGLKKAIKRNDEMVNLGLMFDRFYGSRIVKRAEPVKVEVVQTTLPKTRSVKREDIRQALKDAVIEREDTKEALPMNEEAEKRYHRLNSRTRFA